MRREENQVDFMGITIRSEIREAMLLREFRTVNEEILLLGDVDYSQSTGMIKRHRAKMSRLTEHKEHLLKSLADIRDTGEVKRIYSVHADSADQERIEA